MDDGKNLRLTAVEIHDFIELGRQTTGLGGGALYTYNFSYQRLVELGLAEHLDPTPEEDKQHIAEQIHNKQLEIKTAATENRFDDISDLSADLYELLSSENNMRYRLNEHGLDLYVQNLTFELVETSPSNRKRKFSWGLNPLDESHTL